MLRRITYFIDLIYLIIRMKIKESDKKVYQAMDLIIAKGG